MKRSILVLINLIFFAAVFFINTSKVLATDFFLWDFRSNNDSRIIWQVGFRSIGSYTGTPHNHTTLFELVNQTTCAGVVWCGTGGGIGSPLDGHREYGVQWGTACIDPVAKLAISEIILSNTFYTTGATDITAPNTPGLAAYAAGGGGTLFFSGFGSTANCPVACSSNCSSVGAKQCNGTGPGSTSQTCQTVSGGCTQWVNTTTCTSACDNTTGDCRHRTCASASCVWTAGNGSDSCASSADCTSSACATGERRCIGSCTYQVCSGGVWGASQTCPANSLCTFVGGAAQYSCQSSPGNCTIATYTCQQCVSGSCSTFSSTTPCTTDCSACSVVSC